MKAVSVATDAKGRGQTIRRVRAIGSRYGLRPRRMEHRLRSVLRATERHGHRVTLPVTAAAFGRHPDPIVRCAELGVEFAVHGYRHVDHVRLSTIEQIHQLGRAKQLLEARGIPVTGSRAPYLRWNEGTIRALRENGFLYDCSQAMYWPIEPEIHTPDYERVLGFYGALSAATYPVLPWLEDGIVRLPVGLPDDESLLDRLGIDRPETIGKIWLDVLERTVARGELFTMQVHPERIEPCAQGVASVLEAASTARPNVWIARLDEIARWWRDRADAEVQIRDADEGRSVVSVKGPEGVGILTRNLAVDRGARWSDGYLLAGGTEIAVRSTPRPFIAVHPSSDPSLTSFLRQQGYLVETAMSGDDHAYFLQRERFTREEQLPLLAELETGTFPLVRLTRWPRAARAAVAVTGDVDALTIGDFALRLFGR